jgi:hypothetical protein
VSVGLQVFEKSHAIRLGQIRTPKVAAISVTSPRGVDKTVLLAAGCRDDEAKLCWIILASPKRKRLWSLRRGQQ